MHEPSGWLLTEFQCAVALGLWTLAVLLYAIWRSVMDPEPDTIRESGPG